MDWIVQEINVIKHDADKGKGELDQAHSEIDRLHSDLERGRKECQILREALKNIESQAKANLMEAVARERQSIEIEITERISELQKDMREGSHRERILKKELEDVSSENKKLIGMNESLARSLEIQNQQHSSNEDLIRKLKSKMH